VHSRYPRGQPHRACVTLLGRSGCRPLSTPTQSPLVLTTAAATAAAATAAAPAPAARSAATAPPARPATATARGEPATSTGGCHQHKRRQQPRAARIVVVAAAIAALAHLAYRLRGLAARQQLGLPRAWPPSIFLIKNRCGMGKSQSMWTAHRMETPGTPPCRTTPRSSSCASVCRRRP
jgi:hypothetical protein